MKLRIVYSGLLRLALDKKKGEGLMKKMLCVMVLVLLLIPCCALGEAESLSDDAQRAKDAILEKYNWPATRLDNYSIEIDELEKTRIKLTPADWDGPEFLVYLANDGSVEVVRCENMKLQARIDEEVQKKGKLFSLWTIEEQYYFIEELRQMASDYMDALPLGVESKLQHQYGLPEEKHVSQADALAAAQGYINRNKLVDSHEITQVKTFFYVDDPQMPVWHFSFCEKFVTLIDVQVCAVTGHVVNIIWSETSKLNTYEIYEQELEAKYTGYREYSLEEKMMLQNLAVENGSILGASFRAGIPDEKAIPQIQAEVLARNYIREEYELPENVLSELMNYVDYNVVDPENPIWNIYFYFEDQELESYSVYMDARTGEIIKSYGPGEGNG